MTATGAFDVLKPFAWLALAAFMVGFVSYLALGQPTRAMAAEDRPAYSATVSAPSSDDWNIIKHI